MNSHLKKIVALPFALLFLFVSTFFLTGCLCATPRSETVQTVITITNDSIKNDDNFNTLIGRDKTKTPNKSTLSNLLVTSILDNKQSSDSFKTKLNAKADTLSDIPNFKTDYEKSDSTYTKATMKITNNSPTDLKLKYNNSDSKTKTIKAPNDWSQISGENQVKAAELKLELEFSSSETGSKSNPTKYKITVRFKDVKFEFNEEFVMFNDRTKLSKTSIEIESITKINT